MKIKIDENLFSLNSPKSKGLISGLKKLTERGYSLCKSSPLPFSEIALANIFFLENITINSPCSEMQFDYLITADGDMRGDNILIISDDGKITCFGEAALELIKISRSSCRNRKTRETDIKIEVQLDGNGESEIDTGIGFFDHMLEQIAKHGNLNLKIKVDGDLYVDEHHTVEDVGITLGEAILEALGDKRGIQRYGFFIPMDESVAKCTIDLGGRTYLNFKCSFEREKVGEFPTELTEEFFRGLASGMKANIYLRSKGKNDHHKIEAMFKVFAKALNEACRLDERTQGNLPTTKGML